MAAKLSITIDVNGKEEMIYISDFDDIIEDLEGEDYDFESAKSIIIEYCQDYNPFNKLKK